MWGEGSRPSRAALRRGPCQEQMGKREKCSRAVPKRARARGLEGHPYNCATMLRRFIAVLILHFLLCVGLSAAGVNPPLPVPQGQEVAVQGTQHSPEVPGAFSDADDHALMDNKDDLPDQLEPCAGASTDTANPVAAVPRRVNTALSAITDPPHKPPETAGFAA